MNLAMNSPMIRLLMVGLLLTIAGCGSSNLPAGTTGTVRGTVTYNGKPVPEGSTVIFVREKDGLLASGVTDSSGDYRLRMRDGLKIVTGSYRVSVTPPVVEATLNQDEIMKLQQGGKLPVPAAVKEVPLKYRSPEGSKLVCDVKDGSNSFDIDMKD
ncbi:hypothetical protein Spb1_24290 [Planctopirus ephydatiae]|uniref:Carboxypeptidase regulatory-like domain-containing protein n=2 Tax=Planctopirus ephydatiae TaxID=2528019 RepID=A0A518GPE1_9PLAN|nr:hypothetical protein Spb1_24290 [Planctopirus ephydatiae]